MSFKCSQPYICKPVHNGVSADAAKATNMGALKGTVQDFCAKGERKKATIPAAMLDI